MNLRSKHYQFNFKIDKLFTDTSFVREENVQFHEVHLIGDRDEQEDTCSHFACEYFKWLPEESRVQAIKNAFTTLNNECHKLFIKEKDTSGACVNITIAWEENDKLVTYVANAGDVSSFVFFLDKLKVSRLNDSIHSVDDIRRNPKLKEELETTLLAAQHSAEKKIDFQKKPLISQPGESWRLAGQTLMYRAGGDFGNPYMLREMEIKKIETKLEGERQHRGILVACDGFTDIVNVEPELLQREFPEYTRLIEELKNSKEADPTKNPMEMFLQSILLDAFTDNFQDHFNENIAWNFAKRAYPFTGDNISVAILNPGKTAICVNLNDGHGGDLAANIFSNNLEFVLLDEAYKLAVKMVVGDENSLPDIKFEKSKSKFQSLFVIMKNIDTLFSANISEPKINKIRLKAKEIIIRSIIIENNPALALNLLAKLFFDQWEFMTKQPVNDMDNNQELMRRAYYSPNKNDLWVIGEILRLISECNSFLHPKYHEPLRAFSVNIAEFAKARRLENNEYKNKLKNRFETYVQSVITKNQPGNKQKSADIWLDLQQLDKDLLNDFFLPSVFEYPYLNEEKILVKNQYYFRILDLSYFPQVMRLINQNEDFSIEHFDIIGKELTCHHDWLTFWENITTQHPDQIKEIDTLKNRLLFAFRDRILDLLEFNLRKNATLTKARDNNFRFYREEIVNKHQQKNTPPQSPKP